MTLTVGGNNAAVVSGGNLTESGSLVKAGTGTMNVSNANYTGGTTLNTGSGTTTIRAGNFGSPSSPITAGANLTLSGGTATASTFNLATVGGQTGVGATINGTANLTNTSTILGSSGNTAGAMTLNSSGNVNLGAVKVNKDNGGTGNGLIIAGENVVASSVNIGQSGTGNRAADLNITGGTFTIADASQTGMFALHGAAGNPSMTMSGGTVNYLGTDGMLMSIGAGPSVANLTGGTANLTGVTLNSGGVATTSTLTVNGASNPTLYLGNVGLVINLPAATVAATFGNGTIGAMTDWASDAPITLTNNPIFKAADAANVAHSITLSNVLSGTGGLTKTGNGKLTLMGANTYTGNTTVSAGILDLQQPSLFTNSTVSVATGATLQLSFVGTNQVAGLVLNGISKLVGLYNNSTDTAFLTGTGYLLVISTIPTNISTSVSGNTLTLSWPTDHLGWHLQIQTNSVTVGLNTNWVTLPGSDTVTSTNLTIDPANGSVFYRLVYP